MKKIFLGIISLLFIITFNLNISFANNGLSVFKIYSYNYDNLTDSYYIEGYGSAIYIGNNTIITNNHVVKNNDGKYNGFYNVCETIDFKKEPKCFTIAKLLYVDDKKDLAYLKLINSPKTTKKIEFSDKKINIGDKIYTYGYPSIGGKTITYTSGKISGYDSGKYKIDAGIDSGNSGGGAFDEEGKLIGITTSIISENNTIGYIVPVSDIKNFISKKGNIETFPNFDLKKFNLFIKKYFLKKSSDNITTDYIDLKNISKYGFKIDHIVFNKNKEIYYLTDNNSVYIELYSVIKNIKGLVSTNKTRNIQNKAAGVNSIIQTIYINGKKIIYEYSYNKANGEIEIFFKDSLYGYRVKIYGNINKKDGIKKALLLLFKNGKFKQQLDYEKNIKLAILTINKTANFNFYKYFNYYLYNNEIYGEKNISDDLVESVFINYNSIKEDDSITFSDFYNLFISEKYKYSNLDKGIFYTKKYGGYFYSIIRFNTYNKFIFSKIKKYNGKLYFYKIEFNFLGGKKIFSVDVTSNGNKLKIVKNVFAKEINKAILDILDNVKFEGTEYFSEKDFKSVDGFEDFKSVKNKFYSSATESFKNKKLKITKEESLKFLVNLVGKDLKIGINNTNITTNSINKNFVEIYKSNLKSTKFYRYLPKIDKIIERLPKEKLIKVLKRINKINLVKLYKTKKLDLLFYIKYKILFELEKK